MSFAGLEMKKKNENGENSIADDKTIIPKSAPRSCSQSLERVKEK